MDRASRPRVRVHGGSLSRKGERELCTRDRRVVVVYSRGEVSRETRKERPLRLDSTPRVLRAVARARVRRRGEEHALSLPYKSRWKERPRNVVVVRRRRRRPSSGKRGVTRERGSSGTTVRVTEGERASERAVERAERDGYNGAQQRRGVNPSAGPPPSSVARNSRRSLGRTPRRECRAALSTPAEPSYGRPTLVDASPQDDLRAGEITR